MRGPEQLTWGRVASLRHRVLEWSDTELRQLPWRETRDPWAILVSEVMLQQTQVARVLGPYGRFLERFPTPAACAAAGSAAVVRAWDGLGYNRRARHLYEAAAAICDVHGGVMPADLATLSTLPGVGPYTARAVMTFAYGAPVGIVETNVARVLARAVAGHPLSRSEVQSTADRLVPAERAWQFNQAMIDIGALFCSSSSPRCGACPLRRACRWQRNPTGEDPAATSAGVSRGQSSFAGSDRQGRGRLVGALRLGPVRASEVGAVLGWADNPERVCRVVDGLMADGLVQRRVDGALELSGGPR